MSYELWDTESGNRLATFRTERSAKKYVLAVRSEFGLRGLAALSVGRYDPPTKTTTSVATGRALARWANPEPTGYSVRGVSSPRPRKAEPRRVRQQV